MKKITSELAIKNARSSVEMEGFEIDSETEEICEKILDGKYTLQEFLGRFANKNNIEKSKETAHGV